MIPNLKTRKEIAIEMYEASHEMMLELQLQNDYLKTETAKEVNGSDVAKDLRNQNKKKIEGYINKLSFLKGVIDHKKSASGPV